MVPVSVYIVSSVVLFQHEIYGFPNPDSRNPDSFDIFLSLSSLENRAFNEAVTNRHFYA